MHHMYQHLSEHLAKHPAGFPRPAGGHDIEFLKKLFTGEEAEIAVHLTPRPQSVARLSEKTRIAADELGKILARMADKGVIFETKKGGEPRYSLAPFVPGIYEFQVRNIDEELAHAFENLYPGLVEEFASVKTPWMRVLPAEQSLISTEVVPYEKASEVIIKAKAIAITDCICRKEQKLLGHGCARPKDSICMYLDYWADFAIDKGIGQRGTVEDALKIIKRAEDAGLVHLGMNTKDSLSGFCQCCPCCCGVMRALAQYDVKSAVAKSDYYSAVDIDVCTGCEACVSICPVKAISIDRKNEKAVIKTEDCIGCGLCIMECAPGALALVLKKKDEIVPPPNSWQEMWGAIALEKNKTYFFDNQ
ncbi:MAG: 4Fe-4S dicluster domain-containing protein [Chloroflexi bacterium]|nr:4Fe-4S dicluster domain-containing protein [Chloroflexota bacterium]